MSCKRLQFRWELVRLRGFLDPFHRASFSPVWRARALLVRACSGRCSPLSCRLHRPQPPWSCVGTEDFFASFCGDCDQFGLLNLQPLILGGCLRSAACASEAWQPSSCSPAPSCLPARCPSPRQSKTGSSALAAPARSRSAALLARDAVRGRAYSWEQMRGCGGCRL